MITTTRAGRRDQHETGTARSGPPPDRPPSPAPPPPPPPPRWRSWLLPIGLLLTVALFLLPLPTASKVQQLNYTQLKSDISAASRTRPVHIGLSASALMAASFPGTAGRARG